MWGRQRCFFFSSRRRHTRLQGDWSSDVCSSDLAERRRLQRREAVVLVRRGDEADAVGVEPTQLSVAQFAEERRVGAFELEKSEIGRASCRKECRSRWSPYH